MAQRRTFGASWWGRAWVHALEGRARLDPNRLPRGRTYARQGRVVGSIGVGPGEITATVSGSRPSHYRVHIRVRTFTDEEWDAVLDTIAAKAGHAAALLDGELEPEIAEDVRRAGTDLLPTAGELQPRCSCPDWADPCKHAAAVCYLMADILDTDPFALLLLRGQSRDQVLAGVRPRRTAARSDGAEAQHATEVAPALRHDQGEVAREVWNRPVPPKGSESRRKRLLPARPVTPIPAATDPPPGSVVTGPVLVELARDAAERALGMLVDSEASGLTLEATDDLARRAAGILGTTALDRVARLTGQSASGLTREAINWHHGGGAGVAVASGRGWNPPLSVIERALADLAEVGVDAHSVVVRRNHLSFGPSTQLRYGHDGRWYRLRRHAGRWELDTAPSADPTDLVGLAQRAKP